MELDPPALERLQGRRGSRGDLDFQDRFLEVRRSLQDGGRIERPKSGQLRRVDMSLRLAEELGRLRVARENEALAKS